MFFDNLKNDRNQIKSQINEAIEKEAIKCYNLIHLDSSSFSSYLIQEIQKT
jgi:hypothetical protein